MYLIESITQSASEQITNETIEVLKSKLEGVRESSRKVAELASRSAALVDEYAVDILKVVTAVDSIPEHLPGSSVVKRELRRYLTDFCGVSKETLENPARLRENKPVIAGQDWGNGRQAARFHGL
jgi:hypothetical protein